MNQLMEMAKRKHHQCVFCKSEMKLDDIDYNFEGCQDEDWYCPKCHAALFVKVRYNKVVAKRFMKGDSYVKGKK